MSLWKRKKIQKVLLSKVWINFLLSICCLALPFLNENFFFLIWFGFCPFFFYLDKNKRFPFLKGFFLGLIFFLVSIYWLKNVTYLGWILLSLYCAIYFGIFFYFFAKYKLNNIKDCLFYSSLWVILEFIRANFLGGFSWNMLYNSQIKFLPLIQICSVLGAYSVSFLIIFSNLFLYLCFKKNKKYHILILFFLIGFIYIYGLFVLDKFKESDKHLKLGLIQPNIPIEMKLDDSKKVLVYERIKTQLLKLKDKDLDLIILPETAIPGIINEDEIFLNDLKKICKTERLNVLTGIFLKEARSYYNAAVLIDKKGSLAQIYKKIKLVPFGEYTPLKRFFPFLKKITPFVDLVPGKDYSVFDLKDFRFICLICFEDTFPRFVKEFVKKNRNIDFLVEITNDAWFKSKVQLYQHLSSSVFRSIENRLPALRSANTGISCLILPTGKVLKKLREFTQGELIVNFPLIKKNSQINGSFLFIFFTFGSFLIILIQKTEKEVKRYGDFDR